MNTARCVRANCVSAESSPRKNALMRALTVVLLSSLSACQCLVPVEDDGGTFMDASVMDACSSPSDCTGVAKVTRWCSDGGWSCVQGQCVAQCADQAGQTCVQDDTECLRCPPTAECIAPDCLRSARFSFHVGDITCSEDAGLAVGDAIRELGGGVNCGIPLVIERPNGDEAFGALFETAGIQRSARVESMGGVCVVQQLPTGAIRYLFDCPKCQFSLE